MSLNDVVRTASSNEWNFAERINDVKPTSNIMKEMPRRISSQSTALHKFVVPCVFVLVSIFLIVFARETTGGPPNLIASVALRLMFLPFVVVVFWFFAPLKTVSLVGENLCVSNYRTEITVPLSEVLDVREIVLTEPRRVTIYLRNRTEFGKKIVFLAPYRFFAVWTPHPLVDELILLAASSKQGTD
jgi:hypothetical protein